MVVEGGRACGCGDLVRAVGTLGAVSRADRRMRCSSSDPSDEPAGRQPVLRVELVLEPAHQVEPRHRSPDVQGGSDRGGARSARRRSRRTSWLRPGARQGRRLHRPGRCRTASRRRARPSRSHARRPAAVALGRPPYGDQQPRQTGDFAGQLEPDTVGRRTGSRRTGRRVIAGGGAPSRSATRAARPARHPTRCPRAGRPRSLARPRAGRPPLLSRPPGTRERQRPRGPPRRVRAPERENAAHAEGAGAAGTPPG